MNKLPKYKKKVNRIVAKKLKYVQPAHPLLDRIYKFLMLIDRRIRSLNK